MGTTRHIIFVNRFAYPDHSATSQMLSDLAFGLRQRGLTVAIIASRQRYDAPGAALLHRENVEGVQIYRPWASTFGRASLPGRAVDYLTFLVSACVRLCLVAHKDDIVVVMTDPPMLSVVISPVARLRGARVVNWLQDIFPEVAEALRLPGFRGRAARVLEWLRNRTLHTAVMNVAIGASMSAHIRAVGVGDAQAAVIHNWSDDLADPLAMEGARTLRQAWGLGERFVVGYSGNLGRAHDIDTILDAAGILRADRSIVFLFIGGGRQHEALHAEIERRALQDSFVFQPYQPRDALAASLRVPDVHWISLRPELEGLIVPSKFYGIAAAGRPVLMIGDPEGEVASLLRKGACGLTTSQGDAKRLAGHISALRADPARVNALGQRAHSYFDARFTRERAVGTWQALLNGIA